MGVNQGPREGDGGVGEVTAGQGGGSSVTIVLRPVKGAGPLTQEACCLFPIACPVNAKTKHLPAPCRGRAAGQNERPEGWQMPWHPASPSWAPTLPLSAAHPHSRPVAWAPPPQPKLTQYVERSSPRTCTPPLVFSPPKWTPPTLKPACLLSPASARDVI